MTLDEVIEIIKSGEQMDLADSRLAFDVVFDQKPPVGYRCEELRNAIEDKVRSEYPEQFDELNHADGTFQGNFLILVRDASRINLKRKRGALPGPEPGQWYLPLDGGPWTDYESAEAFARNEVGVPWIIVKVVSTEGQRG